MDRFVTRAPTWQTLNYSLMAAQSLSENKTVSTKRTPSKVTDKRSKTPLQPKQLSEISQTYDFGKRLGNSFAPSNLNQVVHAESINGNSNDSGLSSSSSISPRYIEDENFTVRRDVVNNSVRNNLILTPPKNHLGKLADYIDCPVEKENDTCMTITRSPISRKKTEESGQNPEEVNEVTENLPTAIDKHIQKQSNMIMARIQKDLNSPSASARLKAIKALRSPTKSAYTYFDVPEAEQSLRLPEPPSLQEIMRNIVVYVEVRSGEDNRSAGVRKVIEALGARVNSSLLRDTTHVIFKDGLLSTFKKAKNWGIPIVSILWIEACKNEGRICDPQDYPISNLDRYENPELYSKMKRIKSMQPDSECNKRVRANRAGGGTPKDSTPTQKTGAFKKTYTLNGGTPTSSTNKKKTDISNFFKKLEKSTPNPIAQSGGGDSCNDTMPESPATLLLNRFDSESYTPLELFKKTARSQAKNVSNSPKMKRYVKKALDFIQDDKANSTIAKTSETNNGAVLNKEEKLNTKYRRSNVITKEQSPIDTESGLSPNNKNKPQRRHSLMPVSEIETATDFMKAMAISITPSRATRRRSSLHTPKDMTMENSNKLNNVIEEEELNTQEIPSISENVLKSVGKRRTLYTVATMDQTDCIEMEGNKHNEDKTTHTKSTRRRTIYARKTMETSEMQIDNKINNGYNVTTRRRTCYSVKAIEQTTEITESPSTPRTPRTPARKTVISGKEKHLNEADLLYTTPATTKKDKPSSRRKTLFTKTTDKPNETDTEVSQSNDIDKTIAPSEDSNTDGITVSHFNEDNEHIASSTLVDDKPKETQLPVVPVAPVADSTTGKLLEESEKCAEPIIFSSTRLPGNRRRTLFDVSMDIITHRLQCINQFARRSLAPPTPLSEATNTTPSVANTGAPSTNSSSPSTTSYTSLTTSSSATIVGIKTNIDTETDGVTAAVTTKDSETSVATLNVATPKANDVKKKRKLFMPNELLSTPPPASVPSHETTDAPADVDIVKHKETDPIVVTSEANDVKKKRKLFMPNELFLTPPPASESTSSLINFNTKKPLVEGDHLAPPTNNASTKSATKRRRTLMPISQPQPTIVTQKSAQINLKGVKKRRSTLDFEEIQNIKTKISEVYVDTETSSTSITDKEFVDVQQEVKLKKSPVLVYTNMHHQQIDVIHEAINQLGFFTLETTVTDTTTHLVSLEPRRTLNLLRALARGLWILDYNWITDSLKANKWLPEETYELKNFSRAIEMNRSERQAFGNNFKCELFHKIGDFYITSQCYPITKENMRELIVLCGGRVANNRQKARFIIGDSNQNLPDKLYLTPYWVLDSITKMQLMKINKYIHPLANDKLQASIASTQQQLIEEKEQEIMNVYSD